jgi:fatty-acyl-CoA synthase
VDGWMSTGDLASIDAHGYVRIVGRSKDMIIRGGENIFPAEVEAYLMKMPGVMDVQVIGVPDEKMGEEVCAWIRPKGADISAEQVQAFCKGQIAHYKVPRYVLNRHEFPMTVSGKVKKNEMREETAKLMKKNPNLWTSKL